MLPIMKDDFVVGLVAEYLTSARYLFDEPHSLAHLIHFVDYKDRCIPNLEEIHAGMASVPEVGAFREGRTVFFCARSDARCEGIVVDVSDLQYAIAIYSDQVRTRSRRKRQRDP
jgi:hypothetical protein